MEELPHQKEYRERLVKRLDKLLRGATVVMDTAEAHEASGEPMPVVVLHRPRGTPIMLQIWRDAEGNGPGHIDVADFEVDQRAALEAAKSAVK